MSAPLKLADYVGDWTGTNRLWLAPGEPVRESEVRATLAVEAQGRLLTLRYFWQEDGPQAGLLILSQRGDSDRIEAAWSDSWHMGDALMICSGAVDRAGRVALDGSYAAPPGPDWGWRLILEPLDAGTWRFVMENIPPGSAPVLAVEALLRRGA